MSTSMLSLCCGALPVGGVVRTYQTYHSGQVYHLGHCTLCGGHAPFAPGGELEASPKWLKLPPLRVLNKDIDRRMSDTVVSSFMGHSNKQDRLFTFIGWVALAGWLAFVLLGTWGALRRHGQGEGGQRSTQGVVQEGSSGVHAPKGSSKGGGGQ